MVRSATNIPPIPIRAVAVAAAVGFYSILAGVTILAADSESVLHVVAILAALPVAVFVVMRLEWGIWLIPIAICVPRTLPRPIGEIGYLEITLAFLFFVLVIRSLLGGIALRVDWFLKIMLVISLPMVLSALTGRGAEDWSRVYNWLGTCLTYFLIYNLISNSRAPYRFLLGFAVIVVVMIAADFLVFSGVPLPTTSDEWLRYRSVASTIAGVGGRMTGQANFVASMAFLFIPVPVTYLIFGQKLVIRWLCILSALTISALAILVMTRAFVLCTVVALAAVFVAIPLRRRVWFAVSIVFALLVGSVFLMQFAPYPMVHLVERIVGTAMEGDVRVEIWLASLIAGLESPIWGHGAIGYEAMKRMLGTFGGHGLLPLVFFEYGLAGILPLIVLLASWPMRSLRLLRVAGLSVEQRTVAVAIWGVVWGLLANAVINVHLVLVGPYACLAFSVAALLAAQLRQVRTARETQSRA